MKQTVMRTRPAAQPARKVPAPARKPPAPEISNREKAKAGRRSRIISAVRDIIRDHGADALSMKEIGRRAGVSTSTVFNLFGSKHALMLQVFEGDLRSYQAQVHKLESKDALDRLFDAVRMVNESFAREPEFHRHVFLNIYGGPDLELRSGFRGSRVPFWENLVKEAVAEGFLRADTPTQIFAAGLGHIARAVVMDWAVGEISLDQLEVETGYGFAIALSAIARKSALPRLQEKVAHYARNHRFYPGAQE